jgi:putative ABC transport system ATP-binding protein
MVELLALQGASKTFSGAQEAVLDNINIRINEGDYLAITGPSGSGKSTLLSIIGLLDTLSSGSYFLKGSNVQELKLDQLRQLRNKQIGWVFQNFNLIGSMTCAENVAVPLRYNKQINSSLYKTTVAQALEKVELEDFQHKYPNQLSGGQQQRVAIARAIINQPALIVADEPTGNLDSKTTALIMDLFESLNEKGTSIIVVTHDRSVAKRCQMSMELKDGKIELD